MRRTLLLLAVVAALAAPAAANEPAAEAEAGHEAPAGAHHAPGNPIQNFATFDYKGKEAPGQPGSKLPAPFLAAIVNFVLLAFLVVKLGRPKLVKAVKDRHDELKKALDEGRRLRDETRLRLAEAEARLAKVDAEIAALVAGIRASAVAEAERVVADAHLRAARLEDDARRQVAAELEHERQLIQREALALAVAEAERLLVARLGPADHRGLAEGFAAALEEKR